ncbi:ribonuclease J, partial [Klebsiella oxytoca]
DVLRMAENLQCKVVVPIHWDVWTNFQADCEEIKLLYTLLHPKYAIPVHGEYKHLKAQAKIVRELGIDKSDIF